MGDRTGIEWTDATWNPVSGCDKVSPGCDRCYAETVATRFAGTPAYPDGFAVTLHPERLDLPLRWKRPRRVFVNSMSDLFHDAIPDEYIARVFAVMALAPQHTFQVLTKRHGRMRALLSETQGSGGFVDRVKVAMWGLAGRDQRAHAAREQMIAERLTTWWPLPNVWLGVSVEDQRWADIRIPALLDTPAAVRFISAEPLLGPVDFAFDHDCGDPPHGTCPRTVDWVIVGGESGVGARPMHPVWARGIRDQCTAAGVAFLFKQWGEWTPDRPDGFGGLPRAEQARRLCTFAPDGERYDGRSAEQWQRMTTMYRAGKKAAGRTLDDQLHDGYPDAAPVTV